MQDELEHIRSFIGAHCVTGHAGQVEPAPVKVLYEQYCAWVIREHQCQPWSSHRFGRALNRLGYKRRLVSTSSGSYAVRQGLALKNPSHEVHDRWAG